MSVVTVDAPCAVPSSAPVSTSTARSFVHVLPKSISSAALTAMCVAASCRRRSRVARREIGRKCCNCRLHASPGTKRTIETHVEKAPFDIVPWLLAHDEVATDVEQDVVESRLDAQVAKAAAVELALPIQ